MIITSKCLKESAVLMIVYIVMLFTINRAAEVNDDVFAKIEDDYDTEDLIYSKVYNEMNTRKSRMAEYKNRSRIIDAMLRTPMYNINPAEADPLSFLRDRYDLPKGRKLSL